MEEGDEDEEEEEEETIPEAQEQQGAEFGWFNDLYILDTGTSLFVLRSNLSKTTT